MAKSKKARTNPSSLQSRKRTPTPMNDVDAQIMIADALVEWMEAPAAEEAAFHLLECREDLRSLADVLQHPELVSHEQIRDNIMSFLVHAPNHLVAAHRIVTFNPVTDVFQIGAVEGDGKGNRVPGGPYPSQQAGPKTPRKKR